MVWGVLLIAFVFTAGYIMGNAADSMNNAADDPSCSVPLDLQIFGASAEEASRILNCMGTEGREIYRTAETREDIFYPFIYSLFFSFTLFRLSSYCTGNIKVVRAITALPFAALIADFIENYNIINLISQFPVLNTETVSAYALANKIKWSILFATFFAVALLGVWSFAKILRTNSTAISKK